VLCCLLLSCNYIATESVNLTDVYHALLVYADKSKKQILNLRSLSGNILFCTTGKILVVKECTKSKTFLCHPVKWFKSVTVLVAVLSCNKMSVFTLAEARVNTALPSIRLLFLSSCHTPDKEYVLFVRRHVHREAMHIFWADRLQCASDISCCIYRIDIAFY
jgi:hypothetical protein